MPVQQQTGMQMQGGPQHQMQQQQMTHSNMNQSNMQGFHGNNLMNTN